ncbi:MAG: hypothetical protein GY780_11430 [bacterium]|nr:hypothetical protein [bacterium]
MPNNPEGTFLNDSWECIDPKVGQNVWQLERPDLAENQRVPLLAHLDLCDACRLDQVVEKTVSSGLAGGRLNLPGSSVVDRRHRSWWQHPVKTSAAGMSLIAASLALLFVLPPAADGDGIVPRNADSKSTFQRPVEGEIVLSSGSKLSWTPIREAGQYQIQVSDSDGSFTWSGTTNKTEIELPDLSVQSEGQQYRAILQTIPADLVSPGSISVSFGTGNYSDVMKDRLQKAPLWLSLLGLFGFSLLALGFQAGRKNQLMK